jgi:hypothetical protein
MLTATEACEAFRRVLDAFVSAASSGRNGLAAASQDTDFDDVMGLRQQELDTVVVDVATQLANQRPAQRWAELRAGDASFVDSFSPDLVLRTLRSKREALASEHVGLVGFLMRTGLLQTLSDAALARLRELDDKVVASIRLCLVHKDMMMDDPKSGSGSGQGMVDGSSSDDRELLLAAMQDVVVMRTGYADAAQLVNHLKVAGLAITDVFYAHVETVEDLLPYVSDVDASVGGGSSSIYSFSNRIFTAILLAPTSALRLECPDALAPPITTATPFTCAFSSSRKSDTSNTNKISGDSMTAARDQRWVIDISFLFVFAVNNHKIVPINKLCTHYGETWQ